ncbi:MULTISPECIES: Na/Pi cotransporter family protein [unclassified Bacteroides]|jgi:phosphate:Na+ symporter|uniref:Na/Pi cotransporter family protein n=1 Tax=unclassified Bacteroides TaxID=2646097 RepID=UPI000E7DA40C|nr:MULTISPECIES: Na/Pi cotransporter family protein [unclassified Bacteroides]RGN47093.1 Na/Pi cotransporter family protein [Bacteroides sp. OM05-12]RHR77385.1 Na/Pi cotransporter family protein [Bacteroides sp. AF16-49]
MQYSFYDFLKLIGSLALFLYGMKIMSEGLQKFAGDRLRKILTAMTTNRVTGVLTGILITALIQSSSATTVMVVSFVNAGLLTLTQSISVIMGANIGTTVTAWIISVFGFKVDIAAFALPLLAFGIPLLFSQKSTRKSIGEFIFGFSFLFMGLSFLQKNAPDLSHNPDMLAFVQNYTDMGFLSILLFVFIGTILTMIVQASAATMAITLIMCANGWISFELGAALVLGENIGTTITANLAALTGNTQARRAALAHLVFNVFGVIWVLCLFKPFTYGISWFVEDVMKTTDPAVAVSFKLSAFHTAFNIGNVLIMIWFVNFIEKTVCTLIKQKDDDEYRLRYITGGLLSTAELSILQARKEICLFAERTHRMFNMIRDLLTTTNDNDFNKLFSRVEKYENISDNMELEIANYLNMVSEGRLSSESKLQIRAMLREVTEIESIGDSCYNLARTINRKHRGNQDFTEKQYEHIRTMLDLTDQALHQMVIIVEKQERHTQDVNKSFNIENEINNYRNQLKNQNIIDVNNKEYDYQMGVHYMDIIGECEKLGDYVVNVVEASSDVKEKKA